MSDTAAVPVPAPAPPAAPARRERTRARLLDAAAEVFAEHGFAGTSVEAICDRAGYSRGPFYYNFASKDELFLEVMAREFDRTLTPIEALLAPRADADGPAGEAPSALLDRFPSTSGDELTAARAVQEFRMHAMRDAAVGRAYSTLVEHAQERLGEVLAAYAAARGTRLRAPAETVAAVLISLYLQSVGDGVLARLDGPELAAFVQERVDVVLQLVAPAA